MFDSAIRARLMGMEMGLLQCDLKGAYTSVEHKRLIIAFFEFIQRTTAEDKQWYLVMYVKKWCENRVTFYEKTAVFMRKGLIQGCPFSPIAFVIFLDYSCDDPSARFLYFADDVHFVCKAKNMVELMKKMKSIFEKFESWVISKKMQLEPTKSRCMVFNRTVPTVEKYFDNFKEIPVVSVLRVLGVQVDSGLKFSAHVNKVTNLMRRRVNALRLLKKVGLEMDLAMQFSACVRMGLIFGLYWCCALAPTQWKKLETVWNNLLMYC